MNQLPAVPALGLCLAVPREKAHALLEERIAAGVSLVRERADSEEAMVELKKLNWQWVLETCNTLKEVFNSEAAALYFSASVFYEVSVKLNDLERDLDEFPSIVRGRVERLKGLLMSLPVVPEPPANDFIAVQFHARIYAKTWRPFELGHFGSAIAAAVQEVEDAVKDAVAGNIHESGAELMRQAFEPETGPLRDPELSARCNQGISDLCCGFMERYKGLPANSIFTIQETSRVLSLAGHIMYLIDERKPKPQTAAVEFELLKDEG